MATTVINGIRLYWEQQGDRGAPLVLVHGSWGDHHNWDAVAPSFARSYRVFTYDRRGHSQSERLAAQGHIEEDVADLAALVNTIGTPAHIVGNSFGAAITVKLAATRPDLFASMTIHEPPLLGMLGDHPSRPAVEQRIGIVLEMLRAGQLEAGARQFVDTVALGPGMWSKLPPQLQQTFVNNAPTFLDEMNEPSSVMTVDLSALESFVRPALVTQGNQSPPFFGVILEKIATALPHARRHLFEGAGHVPHVTNPEEYVKIVGEFIAAASSRAISSV